MSVKLQLQAAVSTGASAPTSTSSLWTNIYTSANTTGVYTVGRRPAGSKTYIRARATAPGRVPSAWTVTSGIVTSGLAAPTGIASSSVKAGTATLRWSVGSTTYPIHVYVDTSTSAALTTANALTNLSAGSKEFPVRGLTPNHKHLAAVTHYDPYGGQSAASKTTFTTLSSAGSTNYKTCPAPHGGWVTAGKV